MEPWKIIKMRHGRKSIGNTGQLAYFTKWGRRIVSRMMLYSSSNNAGRQYEKDCGFVRKKLVGSLSTCSLRVLKVETKLLCS